MNFQKFDSALPSLDEPQILEIRRAQNRQRNKRRRDRAVRIDLKLEAIVDKLPIGRRGEFRDRVRAARAREVEALKALPDIGGSMSPEARKRFLALQKFSLAELSVLFIREKLKQYNQQAELEWACDRQIDRYASPVSVYSDRPPKELRDLVEKVFLPVNRINVDAIAIQKAARQSGRYCNHVTLRHPAAPKLKINSVFFC